MARSKWKQIYLSKSMLRNIFLFKISKIKSHKIIFSRASHVPLSFFNKNWYVHTGLKFNKIKINSFMIGYKFGEFALTRKLFFFPKKELKKIKIIRR